MSILSLNEWNEEVWGMEISRKILVYHSIYASLITHKLIIGNSIFMNRNTPKTILFQNIK